MKRLRHLAAAATFALATSLTFTSPADAAVNGLSWVYGTTNVPADGVSAQFASYKVPLVYIGDYSIGQVRASSADRTNIVEAGWNVDAGVNGDGQPHLFVNAAVNGRWDGYNLTGHFTWTNHDITPGGRLAGASGEFSVIHWGTGWWIGYNGTWFGYYGDDLWSGEFTKAGSEAAGGEVYAHTGTVGATQMGSGQIGGKPGAATVARYTLYGAGSQPPLTTDTTDSMYYDAGLVSATGFDFGGAGPSYS